jgi:hypothetical protein
MKRKILQNRFPKANQGLDAKVGKVGRVDAILYTDTHTNKETAERRMEMLVVHNAQ